MKLTTFTGMRLDVVIPYLISLILPISAQNLGTPGPEIANKTALYVGAFFPFGGGWNGSGVIPAVQMAIDDINSRPDILPGYELKMVWNDTQVG